MKLKEILPKLGLLITLTLAATLGASGQLANASGHKPHFDIEERNDLHTLFTAKNTEGTMFIHTIGSTKATVVNTSRGEQRNLPSSTFKIPSSLIAFEEGIVQHPDEVFQGPRPPYLIDGKPLLPAVCEADITFIDAFKNSCIPIYQEIARQLSKQTYKRYLRAFDYGNKKLAATTIDTFWLEGKFAISPREQVEFLKRLYENNLPISQRSMGLVKSMMLTESTTNYRLYGKTGYVFTTSPRMGWWVGWIESKGKATIFALNMDIKDDGSNLSDRAAIGRAILEKLNVL